MAKGSANRHNTASLHAVRKKLTFHNHTSLHNFVKKRFCPKKNRFGFLQFFFKISIKLKKNVINRKNLSDLPIPGGLCVLGEMRVIGGGGSAGRLKNSGVRKITLLE